ncbi:unnamed protein product [Durusdinium trenchii]|uniref:FHA domain-containing protein n=1 Tax=Durusdinium trenchii TaxID=1381693 RepID=A0ABP0H7X7_9DINO
MGYIGNNDDPVLGADDDWLIIHVLYHELLTLIIFDILQNKAVKVLERCAKSSGLPVKGPKISHPPLAPSDLVELHMQVVCRSGVHKGGLVLQGRDPVRNRKSLDLIAPDSNQSCTRLHCICVQDSSLLKTWGWFSSK